MYTKIRTIVAVNLRDAAGLTAKVIRVVPVGTEFVVFGQPVQADDLTWLEVGQSSQTLGWIAEAGHDGLMFIERVGPDNRSTWERCIEFTLHWEGGLSADSSDPGNWTSGKVGSGLFVGTKYGISAASYPSIDIPNLTLERAKEIYARDYWRASGADNLPWPLCLQHFEAAVLSGRSQANTFLAQSGGNPTVYAALRLEFYVQVNTWPYHGAGWTRRVADALKAGAKA